MSDVPFFPHQPHTSAGSARPITKTIVENAVLEHLYEHNKPCAIDGVAVQGMLRALRAKDPRISERDIELVLNKCGYKLDEISPELGDYTFIGGTC